MNYSAIKTSRPQYTEAEIRSRSDYLPGFTEPGDIFDIFENADVNSLWQPVLSTTIVTRLDDTLHVLTGKRSSAGNATHVNVASTPTMRIPPQDMGKLIAENTPFCLLGNIDPLHPFVSESLSPSVTGIPDSSDVLGAKVGNLLALKFQLGSVLESTKQTIGRASLARCVAGFRYLDDNSSGEPLYEPLIMFGAIVGLDSEIAKQIPEETSSYSNLGWTPIEQYVHGVKTRTLLEVIPNASPDDELEVCVRGLCNATSSAILSDLTEIQYHLTEDGILSNF
jgi:hypothetical protein